MALSLMLRNACKTQGSQWILRSNVVGVNGFSSFSRVSHQNTLSTIRKTALPASGLAVSSLGKPQIRWMSAGSDHRLLWTIERILSVSLAGIVPLTIAFPSAVLDNLCTVMVVFHLHWGLEACCEEYVRPIIFGPAIPKVALVLVYLISAVTLGGMLYFNYTDIGVGKAIRKFWAIK